MLTDARPVSGHAKTKKRRGNEMPWPGYEWGILNPVERPSQLGQSVRGEYDFYETDPMNLALQAGQKLLEPDALKDVDIWKAIVLREVDAKEHSATKEIQRRFKIKLMEGDACIPFDGTKDYSKSPKSVKQITADQHFADMHITATAGAAIPYLKPGDRCLIKFQHKDNFKMATIVGVPDAKQSEIQQRAATAGLFVSSELSKISHMRKYLVTPNEIKGQLKYLGSGPAIVSAVLDYESYNFESQTTNRNGLNNFSTWNANDAGAGVSFGFIQFNQKVGSLLLLFQQMYQDDPDTYNQHFGKYADKLRNRRWLRGTALRDNTLNTPELKTLITRTGRIKTFRDSQYKVAKRGYFDPAVRLCNEYNLKSVNAYAMCTGIAIQFGVTARRGLQKWLAETRKQVGADVPKVPEYQFLKVLANLVDRARWQMGMKKSHAARANHSLKNFLSFLQSPPGGLHRFYRHKGGKIGKGWKNLLADKAGIKLQAGRATDTFTSY